MKITFIFKFLVNLANSNFLLTNFVEMRKNNLEYMNIICIIVTTILILILIKKYKLRKIHFEKKALRIENLKIKSWYFEILKY